MKEIKIIPLNTNVDDCVRMAVLAARITQRSEKIKTADDFIGLYNKPFSDGLVKTLCELPHPTLQKLGVINVAVVGASRRFLAQVTRHQNEVKFISGSCQYSDYSDDAQFVIPYNMLNNKEAADMYLEGCKKDMKEYKVLAATVGNDEAGYKAPQGLRNVLVISATPYQWKHMISQRTCRRNTDETRYVFLSIWRMLYTINPIFFGNCGPFCMQGSCKEGKMTCGKPMYGSPLDIILHDYPILAEDQTIVECHSNT